VAEAQSTLARPAPSPPKAITNLLARVQAGLDRQAQASSREQAREKERRERMIREQATPNQSARAGGTTGPQAAAGTAAHTRSITRSQPTAQKPAAGAAGATMAKAAAAASRSTMLRQEPASIAEQPVSHPDSSEGLPSWITALERTYNGGSATYPTANSPPPPTPRGDDNLQYTSPLMASMAKG